MLLQAQQAFLVARLDELVDQGGGGGEGDREPVLTGRQSQRQGDVGLQKLFKQFSFPGGIPSHASPECPGSIHEGGELGYSLSHSFGAVFDNPDLIVACVVGDGEAETGPLATAWHSNKFLDAATDGAVLPILLFAGAIHVKLDELSREWPAISLLAIVGTLASTFIVGGTTWLVLGWLDLGIPFLHAALFRALISPTDPIAVLGIMKSAGASRQLEVQMAGESLFNDGLGVVVFLVLLQLSGLDEAHGAAAAPLPFDVGAVGMLLLKEVGGALVLALAAGIVTYQMLKRVDNYQVEVLLTLALAMGLCALADALHLSAPIAVVVAGLFVGNRGRVFATTQKTREHVDAFWELVDDIVAGVLILSIGLEILVLPIERGWLVAGVLAIPIVLAAHWLSVAGIIGPLSRVTAQSQGAIAVLTWGGSRGGISVAMALSVSANPARSLVLTLTPISWWCSRSLSKA